MTVPESAPSRDTEWRIRATLPPFIVGAGGGFICGLGLNSLGSLDISGGVWRAFGGPTVAVDDAFGHVRDWYRKER